MVGKNKEFAKLYMREYNRVRYQTNEAYRLKTILNARIRSVLKSKKNQKTLDFIGLDLPTFKMWIEYQFDDNMSWENMGSYWHFDHVRPCSSFDIVDPSQMSECFHWTNLQPLEKIANLKKHNTILPDTIACHSEKVEMFLKNLQQVQ